MRNSRARIPRGWPRWHRRIGLGAALLVLVLSVTGVLLNHSNELGLDNHSPSAKLLTWIYGVDAPQPRSFPAASQWISQLGNQLFLNDVPLTACSGSLVGAVVVQGGFAVACADELLLLDESGQLVERIGAGLGVPQPISALGLEPSHKELVLANGELNYRADLVALDWQQTAVESVAWSQPQPLPSELQHALASHTVASELTWERLLLDLHSGRVLGTVGVWLMDLAALALIILSVTGFVMWRKKRRLGG